MLAELGEEAEGELKGRLEIGASTGPGGSVLPVLLGEFQQLHPQAHVALTVSDTQTVVEQVGRRELELGVVGAAGRHRGVSSSRSTATRSSSRSPPATAAPARRSRLDELKAEPLVLMQEGAGIRQMIDDELRELGLRLRDLNVQLELGLQESARAAVLGGFGATFISRIAIEGDLAAGTLAVAKRRGARAGRETSSSCVRPAAPRRASRRRSSPSRASALVVIVRWGLDSLAEACAEAGVSSPLLVASPRWDALELAVEPVARWQEVPSDRIAEAVAAAGDADGVLARRRRERDRPREGDLRRRGAAARLGADDVRRRRVDELLRRPRSAAADARRRRRRASRRRSSTSRS